MPRFKTPAISIKLFAITLLGLYLLINSKAGAATLEGQDFEDGIRLAQHQLRLNGMGVRKIFFIKAYVAGLYADEKAATLPALVALPGLGTQLALNGTKQGQAIFGADFYEAILGIFVGDKPVDSMLKKGLLGQ